MARPSQPSGRPSRGGGSGSGRGGGKGGASRAGGPGNRDGSARNAAPAASGRRGGPAASGRAGGSGRGSDGPRRQTRSTEPGARTREQAAYDGPPLDDSITGKELDRSVAGQLRGLPDRLAARVARHLVAAGLLMDSDPQTAYQHALAARSRAARVAVVREACGEAAYAAGEYADALSELRAAKRMKGSADYLAVMADCERALGRPDRALSLARDPALARADDAVRVEMTIVEAGARRDLGQLDAALRTLEGAPLRSRSRADWVARLRYAYADTLLAAGRHADAVEWFHRTVAVDGAQITDAADRVAELENTDGQPG